MDDLQVKMRIYVQEHLSENIKISDLAEHLGYSAFYLCRKFKKVTGYTVKTYVRNLKMENAEKMLRNGMSVTQVTYACGYETLSGFEKAFKKKYRYSPRNERKFRDEKK